MKKKAVVIVILMIGFAMTSKSQPVGEWSTPSPFTDSTSFNTNPEMVWGTPIIFYEKKPEPEYPSDIYCVNLNSYCGEMKVVGDSLISYRNPKGLTVDNKYIFYESDETGNFELYALSFDENCNFGNPVRLTYTTEDESSMMIDGLNNIITYLQGNTLIFAQIFTNPDTVYLTETKILDTVQAVNPVFVNSWEIFWQRFESGEYHIYRSIYEYGEWSEPEPVFTQGNNVELNPVKGTFYAGWGAMWKNEENIMFYTPCLETIDTLAITEFDTLFQICPFQCVTIIDSYEGSLSFTSGNGQNQEIYIFDNFLVGQTVNISNNDRKDSNSELFTGPIHPYFYEWYCLWESETDGYSTLYYSEQDVIYGGINENINEKLMVISPNPFGDELKIEIRQPETPAIIEIYDLNGKKHFFRKTRNGEAVIWNPAKQNPELKEGIYIVSVKQGSFIETKKIIYKK